MAEARQRVLERAGSGDAQLAAAVAYLVTETGEAQPERASSTRRWAMTGASWTASSTALMATDFEDAVCARAWRWRREQRDRGRISAPRCARDRATLRAVRDWLARRQDSDAEARANAARGFWR